MGSTITALRSFRPFMNLAAFDMIASVAFMLIITRRLSLPDWKAFILVLPVSTVIHIVFGSPTPLTSEVINMKPTARSILTLVLGLVSLLS